MAGARRRGPGQALPLFDDLPTDAEPEPASPLPALTTYEEVLADYKTAGLSLRRIRWRFYARCLRLCGFCACELATTRPGRQVRVAGLVLMRQRPSTAKGITFVTLEDETGVANLIVRFDVWQRYRMAARNASALMAQGRLERQGEVIHVLTNKLVDLAQLSQRVDSRSRDFR